MVDFEFHIDQKYYNKYLNSLIAFIQGMQRQLQASYDHILRVAYEQEVEEKMQEEIQV